MVKFPQEEHPVNTPQRLCAPGDAAAGRILPAQDFQPAVLLSPPRQKNSPELSPLHNSEISLAEVDLEVCVVCVTISMSEAHITFGVIFSYFNLPRHLGPIAGISCFCTQTGFSFLSAPARFPLDFVSFSSPFIVL